MLVEIKKAFVEHSLTDDRVQLAVERIITTYSRHLGISHGSSYVEKRDETGKLIEAAELRRIPGEPNLLSIVRPGIFSVLVRSGDGHPPVLDYSSPRGFNMHNSDESLKVVAGVVENRTRPHKR